MDVAISLVTQLNTHNYIYKKPIGGQKLTSMDDSEFSIQSARKLRNERDRELINNTAVGNQIELND